MLNVRVLSAAQWGLQSSRYILQLWPFRPPSGSGVAYIDPYVVLEQLGSLHNRRYDFVTFQNHRPVTR